MPYNSSILSVQLHRVQHMQTSVKPSKLYTFYNFPISPQKNLHHPYLILLLPQSTSCLQIYLIQIVLINEIIQQMMIHILTSFIEYKFFPGVLQRFVVCVVVLGLNPGPSALQTSALNFYTFALGFLRQDFTKQHKLASNS